MLIPQNLRDLIAQGLIQDVLRPLKSGKEAAVFVVLHEGQERAAKVYKAAERRNFRARADYVEGRRVGDSRQQRAMDRGSKFGKQQSEAAWQTAEARAMARLYAAGVRVPKVLGSADGCLVMDLVVDANGDPAPQLAHSRFTHHEALKVHALLMRQVALMLCAGLIHADLSEFNILHAADGPMIIDVPQAVEAARNNNAKRMLIRDVDNVTRFLAKFAPEIRRTEYAQEMWLLYQNSSLRPDSPLTGRFKAATNIVNTDIILREIQAAKEEAARREEIKQARGDKSRRGGKPA
ncbi:MAG: serine protein kinase RIO [Planctomycetes bacterium]|nr:serine protein kinase RIO [Planctomycetota bacterium]